MRIEDLVPLVTTFVLAGATLSIGIAVMEGTEQSFDLQTESNSYTLTNLTYVDLGPEHVVSISSVANATFTLGSGNYSLYKHKWIYSTLGSTTSGTDDIQDATAWTVNYSIYSKDAFNTAHNATVGLGELASWMPTIGLVLAAALVMGVIYTSFVGRGAR